MSTSFGSVEPQVTMATDTDAATEAAAEHTDVTLLVARAFSGESSAVISFSSARGSWLSNGDVPVLEQALLEDLLFIILQYVGIFTCLSQPITRLV